MDIIFKIGITMLFSSSFVSFILLVYFKIDNKIYIDKSKFINIYILLVFLHAVLQNILPNFIFPFFLFIFSAIFLAIVFNINLISCFKTIVKFFILTLLIEIILDLFATFVLKLEFTNLKLNVVNLLYSVPFRIIEAGIILFIKKEGYKMVFLWWNKIKKGTNTKKAETEAIVNASKK